MILGLLDSGIGITVLLEYSVVSLPPNVSALPFSDTNKKFQTVAAWKKDRTHGAKRLFVDFIRRMSEKPASPNPTDTRAEDRDLTP